MSATKSAFLEVVRAALTDASSAAALLEELQLPQASLVVSLSGFEHHAGHHGALEATAWALRVEEVFAATVESLGGRRVGAEPLMPAARFDDPKAALETALRMGRERGVGVAVAWGPLLVSPGGRVFGASHARARRLAALCGSDAVATAELLAEAGVPEGVGSFRASEALEALVGGPYHVLFDGRD